MWLATSSINHQTVTLWIMHPWSMLSCGSLRKQMSSTLLSCFKPTLNIFVRCRIVCPMTSSTVVQKIANQCSVQVLIEIILHKKYWSLCPLLQCGPKPDNGKCGGDILCRVSFFAFLFIRRRIKSKSQQGLWYIYILQGDLRFLHGINMLYKGSMFAHKLP